MGFRRTTQAETWVEVDTNDIIAIISIKITPGLQGHFYDTEYTQ